MEIGGSTLLVHFQKNGYDVDRLKPYEDFLLECRQKDIESYAKHKHHILPVFMGGSNESDNFIILTPEDHFKAHIILAECFDRKSNEYKYNISSGNLIRRVARRTLKRLFGENIETYLLDFWKSANEYTKDAMIGEGNPMYGKKHTEEVKNKISSIQSNRIHSEQQNKKHSERMKGSGNPNYGKKYTVSEDRRMKIKEINRVISLKRWPLPDGVSRVSETNNKKFSRHCPNCNTVMYYTTRSSVLDSHNLSCVCKKCAGVKIGNTLRGRKLENTDHLKGLKKDYTNVGRWDKSGSKNPNAKKVIDHVTGRVYGTIKELSVELGVSVDVVRLKIKKGEYSHGNA